MLSVAEIIGSSAAWGILGFFGGLGPWEIAIIVIVVLLLFGGKKIPELAKGIGRGMREFKKEMRGVREDFEQAVDEEPQDDYAPPPRRKKRRRKPKPEATEGAEDTDGTEDTGEVVGGDELPADETAAPDKSQETAETKT